MGGELATHPSSAMWWWGGGDQGKMPALLPPPPPTPAIASPPVVGEGTGPSPSPAAVLGKVDPALHLGSIAELNRGMWGGGGRVEETTILFQVFITLRIWKISLHSSRSPSFQ